MFSALCSLCTALSVHCVLHTHSVFPHYVSHKHCLHCTQHPTHTHCTHSLSPYKLHASVHVLFPPMIVSANRQEDAEGMTPPTTYRRCLGPCTSPHRPCTWLLSPSDRQTTTMTTTTTTVQVAHHVDSRQDDPTPPATSPPTHSHAQGDVVGETKTMVTDPAMSSRMAQFSAICMPLSSS